MEQQNLRIFSLVLRDPRQRNHVIRPNKQRLSCSRFGAFGTFHLVGFFQIIEKGIRFTRPHRPFSIHPELLKPPITWNFQRPNPIRLSSEFADRFPAGNNGSHIGSGSIYYGNFCHTTIFGSKNQRLRNQIGPRSNNHPNRLRWLFFP